MGSLYQSGCPILLVKTNSFVTSSVSDFQVVSISDNVKYFRARVKSILSIYSFLLSESSSALIPIIKSISCFVIGIRVV